MFSEGLAAIACNAISSEVMSEQVIVVANLHGAKGCGNVFGLKAWMLQNVIDRFVFSLLRHCHLFLRCLRRVQILRFTWKGRKVVVKKISEFRTIKIKIINARSISATKGSRKSNLMMFTNNFILQTSLLLTLSSV